MTASAPIIEQTKPVRRLRRWMRFSGWLAIWVMIIVMSLWAVLAIRLADLSGAPPRTFRSLLLAIAILSSIIFIRRRTYRFATIAFLILCVLGWYFSISPSNDRDWKADAARTPTVEIDGDRVVVHNVRDCDWRSDDDFTVTWIDNTYRLSDLQTIDLLFSHWGSKAIAHAMVSFGFADGRHLCASIETRVERSERQNALQSFFRQYELVYVFAEERDLIRVRTNVRNENVYLYRTNATSDEARALFLSYAQRADSLAATPQFYNGLTSNCATNIVTMSRVVNPKASVTWRVLLSGYAPRQLYDNGRLDTSMPFEELEEKSLIDAAAKAANDDPDFSKAIRIGRPVPMTQASARQK